MNYSLADLPEETATEPSSFQPTLGEPIAKRSQLSAAEFFEEYAMKHRPVVITDALQGWTALNKWTPDFFAQQYGKRKIQLRNGTELTIGDLIAKVLQSTEQAPAPYWTNAPMLEHFPELLADINAQLPYFAPNWGARRFLHKGMQSTLNRGSMIEIYIGGSGGAFPVVHWDGMSSHAFLMQIYGRKRYYTWPPEDSEYLYPQTEPPNLSPIRNVDHPDLEKYPLFAKARLTTFVLEPGEMLFVPSRWWHTAKMLSPSITLSINTVNGSNWDNFAEDMTRKAGKATRWLKQSYLAASKARNQLLDVLTRAA